MERMVNIKPPPLIVYRPPVVPVEVVHVDERRTELPERHELGIPGSHGLDRLIGDRQASAIG